MRRRLCLLLSTVRVYRGVSTIDREFISAERRLSSLYFPLKVRVLSRGTGPRVVSWARGRKSIQFVQPGRESARFVSIRNLSTIHAAIMVKRNEETYFTTE